MAGKSLDIFYKLLNILVFFNSRPVLVVPGNSFSYEIPTGAVYNMV